jgi:hypothetical protein
MSLNWERCSLVAEHVDEEAIAERGFKPGALGGHDTIRIRNDHQFLNSCRIQPKREGSVTTIDQHRKLLSTTNAALRINCKNVPTGYKTCEQVLSCPENGDSILLHSHVMANNG